MGCNGLSEILTLKMRLGVRRQESEWKAEAGIHLLHMDGA